MRFPTSFSLLSLAFLPFSLSQSLDANGLVQALQSSGLSQLAQAAMNTSNTPTGQQLLNTLLSGQNVTVFAPTDQAFNNASSRLSSAQPNDVANVLAYHVLIGNFSSPSASNALLGSDSPAVTVARTLLNDTEQVKLEGNKSQVVAWTRENGAVQFLNQNSTTTVQNVSTFQTITIAVVDHVLAPPRQLSNVLGSNQNLSMLASVLGAQVPGLGSNNGESLVNFVESQRGVTIFAPDNVALGAVGSTLSGLQSNTTALATLIGNHIINGSTIYSSLITNGSTLTSSQGETLTFTTNSSGTFVSSGQSIAQIIQTDLLTENGVVHVINGVLVNLDSNQDAARSAFESATSSAGILTTPTAPLSAPTSTSGGGTDNGNGSGSGSGGNGARALLSDQGLMMSVMVSVLVGGLLV